MAVNAKNQKKSLTLFRRYIIDKEAIFTVSKIKNRVKTRK